MAFSTSTIKLAVLNIRKTASCKREQSRKKNTVVVHPKQAVFEFLDQEFPLKNSILPEAFEGGGASFVHQTHSRSCIGTRGVGWMSILLSQNDGCSLDKA